LTGFALSLRRGSGAVMIGRIDIKKSERDRPLR
jgi:hypothetical protein